MTLPENSYGDAKEFDGYTASYVIGPDRLGLIVIRRDRFNGKETVDRVILPREAAEWALEQLAEMARPPLSRFK